MKQQNKIGIIVGRFQVPELHPGHRYLIDKTIEMFDQVYILLGVSKELKPDKRNPLSFEARKTMLLEYYPQLNERIFPIRDLGNWPLWVKGLDIWLEENISNLGEIYLVGSRDSVPEKYKEYGGKFNIELLPEMPNESGTQTRESLLTNYKPDWNLENRKLAIWLINQINN